MFDGVRAGTIPCMAKHCPSCLEEYRDDMTACADCEVDLVGSAEEAELLHLREQRQQVAETEPEEAPEDEHPEVSLFVASIEVGEEICDMLVQRQCPAYLDDVPGEDPGPGRVAVPEEFGAQAAQLLHAARKRFTAKHLEGGSSLYDFRDEDEELRNWPVLAIAPKDIGPGHLDELLSILDDADAAQLEQTAVRLLALDELGIAGILRVIVEHAAEIPEVATIHAFSILAAAREAGRKLPDAYRQLVEHAADTVVRRDLLRVPGIINDDRFNDLLVGALEDDDIGVRAEAIDALWRLTGDTLEYDPDAPAEARAPAVAAWKARIG